MERLYDEFGKRVRSARRAAHLSQQEVGQRVGLTRSSIANIELGRQRIGLHTLYAIATAVETMPAALLPEGIFANRNDEALIPDEVLKSLSPRNQELIQELLEGTGERRR